MIELSLIYQIGEISFENPPADSMDFFDLMKSSLTLFSKCGSR